MDISNIKVIISASGAVFVGQEEVEKEPEQPRNEDGWTIGLVARSNRIKLKYPFRFMLDQSTGNLKVMAPVLKEQFIIIDMTGSVECDVNPEVERVYRQYCESQFGSGIVLPEDKRVII